MGHGTVSESPAHCPLHPWVSAFPPQSPPGATFQLLQHEPTTHICSKGCLCVLTAPMHADIPQLLYPKSSVRPLFPPALLTARVLLSGQNCPFQETPAAPVPKQPCPPQVLRQGSLQPATVGNAPSDCWGADVHKILLCLIQLTVCLSSRVAFRVCLWPQVPLIETELLWDRTYFGWPSQTLQTHVLSRTPSGTSSGPPS